MKLIQFSIPRLRARQDEQRKNLIEKGVPEADIEVFEGPDGRDYTKTIEVFEKVVADGFSHYQAYIDKRYDNWMALSIAAQMWGYLKLFRDISRRDAPVMVIHDDWLLKKPYEAFICFRDHAVSVSEHEQVALKYIALHHTHLREDMWIAPVDIPPERILVRGVLSMGADIAFIISPAGASWLLENWSLPDMHPTLECVWEVFMTEAKDFDEEFDITGIYSTKDIGNVESSPNYKSEIFTDTDAGRAGKEHLIPISQTRRNL